MMQQEGIYEVQGPGMATLGADSPQQDAIPAGTYKLGRAGRQGQHMSQAGIAAQAVVDAGGIVLHLLAPRVLAGQWR